MFEHTRLFGFARRARAAPAQLAGMAGFLDALRRRRGGGGAAGNQLPAGSLIAKIAALKQAAIKERSKPNRRVGRSGRVYQGRAFGRWDVEHRVRRRFIDLVEYPWFDRVVLLLIIVNSVTMAAQNPLDDETPDWATACEWVFTVMFSVEAACKICAEGLVFDSPDAYLTDTWNWIDLLTVIVSWVSLLLPDAGNLSAIRSVRVLKPLRTVQRVPGLRVLIGALIHSLPGMGDVANLFAFFLLAFSVVGVELFAGTLHYRCYETVLGALATAEGTCPCSAATREELASGNASCNDKCPAGFECRYTDTNPADGATSFDNIFHSIVNVFQVRVAGRSPRSRPRPIASPRGRPADSSCPAAPRPRGPRGWRTLSPSVPLPTSARPPRLSSQRAPPRCAPAGDHARGVVGDDVLHASLPPGRRADLLHHGVFLWRLFRRQPLPRGYVGLVLQHPGGNPEGEGRTRGDCGGAPRAAPRPLLPLPARAAPRTRCSPHALLPARAAPSPLSLSPPPYNRAVTVL